MAKEKICGIYHGCTIDFNWGGKLAKDCKVSIQDINGYSDGVLVCSDEIVHGTHQDLNVKERWGKPYINYYTIFNKDGIETAIKEGIFILRPKSGWEE
jgi:hypothetical protein